MGWEWLSQLLQALTDFIPRPLIVATDERCVLFLFGKYPKVLKPGWYLNMPAFMKVHHFYVMHQFAESIQRYKNHAYKWQISFEIDYPLLYSIRTSDQNNIVLMEGQRVFGDFFQRFPDEDPTVLKNCKKIQKRAYKVLKEFGIKVKHLNITNACEVYQTYSLWELNKEVNSSDFHL